jgi:hypothetical protein
MARLEPLCPHTHTNTKLRSFLENIFLEKFRKISKLKLVFLYFWYFDYKNL